jgi:hypothetical protein
LVIGVPQQGEFKNTTKNFLEETMSKNNYTKAEGKYFFPAGFFFRFVLSRFGRFSA